MCKKTAKSELSLPQVVSRHKTVVTIMGLSLHPVVPSAGLENDCGAFVRPNSVFAVFSNTHNLMFKTQIIIGFYTAANCNS